MKLTKGMVNGINFTKLLYYSIYEPYSIGNLQMKAHQDWIEPRLETLNLVHSDVIGSFIKRLYGATYFVTFLYNATKRSEVVFLTKKSGVFPAFKRYCLNHKKRDKQVWELELDEGEEYDSHKFTKFCDEHGIVKELILPGNPQMNGVIE